LDGVEAMLEVYKVGRRLHDHIVVILLALNGLLLPLVLVPRLIVLALVVAVMIIEVDGLYFVAIGLMDIRGIGEMAVTVVRVTDAVEVEVEDEVMVDDTMTLKVYVAPGSNNPPGITSLGFNVDTDNNPFPLLLTYPTSPVHADPKVGDVITQLHTYVNDEPG
jgi:hypothetical protein